MRMSYGRASSVNWDEVKEMGLTGKTFRTYIGGAERGYDIGIGATPCNVDAILKALHGKDWRRKEIARLIADMAEETVDVAALKAQLKSNEEELDRLRKQRALGGAL